MTYILAPETGISADELELLGFKSAASKKPEDVDSAEGIPDRKFYGDHTKIPPNALLDFVIQRHLAQRAGPHFDVRFGDPAGLFSWATRKPMPSPGGRTALFQQPMHSYKYKDFEGTIPAGKYGAGRVSTHRSGRVIVTGTGPNTIHFTLADQKYPERFVLVKPTNQKKPTDWLLINKTPVGKLPIDKPRYQRIPTEKVEAALAKVNGDYSAEVKLDGASTILQLLQDGIEATSYRASKTTGRPIVHTERLFAGLPKLKIPPELVGTILRGEIYGQQDDRVIGPQELGGLLNSKLTKSLDDQAAQNIKLRTMVYDIAQKGKQKIDWETVPRSERRKMIQDVLKHLPADKFHISEEITDPEAAKETWQRLRNAEHPLSSEGLVLWPKFGRPLKAKTFEEYDVYPTGTFPGEGKLKDTAIGGLTYALEPGGPTVGKVGTGFTDELRRQIYDNPNAYVGRVARIRSHEQFPSGAFRAPGFIGFHEDYPSTVKRSSILVEPDFGCTLSELDELGIDKSGEELSLSKEADNYLWRGLRATPFAYNSQKSILDNLLSYMSRGYNRGRQFMDQAYSGDGLAMELSGDPNSARWSRLLQNIRGIDPVLTHPADRLAYRYGPAQLKLGTDKRASKTAEQSRTPTLTKQAGRTADVAKGLWDYLRGARMVVPRAAGAYVPPNAFAEEQTLLKGQQLLRKLTGGLSDKPFFHVQDRIIGGVPGAIAGGLIDQKSRQHSGSASDKLGRLAAVAGGGWAGGKGLNTVLNVGRKYISNVSPLAGYSTKNIPKASLRKIWEHGVLDRPSYDVGTLSEELQARRELLRRYLGIHKPNSATDYFIRTASGDYKYNPETVRPGTDRFKKLLEGPAKRRLELQTPDDIMNPPGYSSGKHIFSNVFGGHDLRYVPGSRVDLKDGAQKVRYQIGDAWNFAIDPGETDIAQYIKGLAATSPNNWRRYWNQTAQGTVSELGGKESIGARLHSAGLRTLLEKIFRHHTPVTQHDLEILFQPAKNALTSKPVSVMSV